MERKKTKAIMYPRDAILVGMEDLSGKGGTVASGFSLFQQLGGWHLNLNCWVSSGVCYILNSGCLDYLVADFKSKVYR